MDYVDGPEWLPKSHFNSQANKQDRKMKRTLVVGARDLLYFGGFF